MLTVFVEMKHESRFRIQNARLLLHPLSVEKKTPTYARASHFNRLCIFTTSCVTLLVCVCVCRCVRGCVRSCVNNVTNPCLLPSFTAFQTEAVSNSFKATTVSYEPCFLIHQSHNRDIQIGSSFTMF